MPIRIMHAEYSWLHTFSFLLQRSAAASAWEAYKDISLAFENELLKEVPKSIIAHSYGSIVLYTILQRFKPGFYSIFLTGSVCRRDHAEVLVASAQHVINEVGTQDRWPIFAQALSPRSYEATGTYGFRENRGIRDRYFDYLHSSAIEKEHVIKHIAPILNGQDPVSGPLPGPQLNASWPVRVRYCVALVTLVIATLCWSLTR
jgi:hypothetical protein